MLDAGQILGMQMHAASPQDAARQVVAWTKARERRMVCVLNSHMILKAQDSEGYKQIMSKADLVLPESPSLAWILRRLGFSKQRRVTNTDLMSSVLAAAREAGLPVGFYGGTPEGIKALVAKMNQRFPGLQIVYAYSPSSRPQCEGSRARELAEIHFSNLRILFVGLTSPKQERWMAENRGKVEAVMVGVATAFELLAGAPQKAPNWIQKLDLAWLFQPFRTARVLWRHYLTKTQD